MSEWALPSVHTGLLGAATASKLPHVPASRALATVCQLAHLGGGGGSRKEGGEEGWWRPYPKPSPYFADTTALATRGSTALDCCNLVLKELFKDVLDEGSGSGHHVLRLLLLGGPCSPALSTPGHKQDMSHDPQTAPPAL